MITAVTEATFQNEVNDHPGRVVIDFYTPIARLAVRWLRLWIRSPLSIRKSKW